MNPEAIKAAALAWERGRALQKAGHYREAEPHFRAALKTMPRSAALLSDYGRLAEQLNDWRAAERIWLAVSQLDPAKQVGDRMGLALLQQGRVSEALPWLEAFAARFPDDTDSAVNLAFAYTRLLRDDEAIAVLRKAVKIRPQQQLAWESLVTLLINAGDAQGAAEALQAATALFPQSSELHYMLMDHRLKNGQYGEGFDLFDARWGTRFFAGELKRPDRLRWDGKPFSGKLLVRAEQGVGDELLISSVFGDLAARHAETVVECDPRLVPLFARSWPALAFVARNRPDSEPPKSGFSHDIMAGDLCRLFRRDVSDFPARDRWLEADATQTATIASRYRARFPGQRLVGISWRSMHPSNGTAKSLALAQLLPILRTPGVTFIDLQYGDTAAELERLRSEHGIDIHHDAGFNALADLDGFASQLAALDLVISTSNSTVHLAGALGVPTWVLLHRDQGLPWYWGYEGSTVPWYPHTTLLRCRRRGEWEPVIADTARRLAEFTRPTA